jgi:DHA3 family macrolide efflux protein-like MFS transporter
MRRRIEDGTAKNAGMRLLRSNPGFARYWLSCVVNRFGESSAQVVGLAAAGGLIAKLGVPGAIAVDAVCFFAAAALIAGVDLPQGAASEDAGGLTPSAFFSELKAGLRYISATKAVLICIILGGLTNFFLGPLNVLLPVFVKDRLAAGATALSLVFTIETLAMVGGSLAAASLAAAIGDVGCLRLGFAGIGTGYALLYMAGSVPAAIACLAVLGFALPFANTGFTTLMQKSTPLHMMGRISAVRSTLVLCAIPLSTSIAGVMGDKVNVNLLFGMLGLMVLTSTLSLTFHPALVVPGDSGVSYPTA